MKYLGHPCSPSQKLARQAFGPWQLHPEYTLLALIPSCLNSSTWHIEAHTLLILKFKSKKNMCEYISSYFYCDCYYGLFVEHFTKHACKYFPPETSNHQSSEKSESLAKGSFLLHKSKLCDTGSLLSRGLLQKLVCKDQGEYEGQKERTQSPALGHSPVVDIFRRQSFSLPHSRSHWVQERKPQCRGRGR